MTANKRSPRKLRPAREGEGGQLHTAGEGVAPGYPGDARKTAQQAAGEFVVNGNESRRSRSALGRRLLTKGMGNLQLPLGHGLLSFMSFMSFTSSFGEVPKFG
jgi:hypothetical protein